MTTITNYSDLVSAVTEWFGRDGDTTFITRIPTFIQMAEAKLNRNLRAYQQETRATAIVNRSSSEPEYISLPDDYQTMRRLRLSSVDGRPYLDFLNQNQANEMTAKKGNVSSQPQYYAIMGSEMQLIPTPDSAYTLEMVYRASLPALTSTNTTNWLLEAAPDLYLYGCLLEAAAYVNEKDTTRLQVWAAAFKTALDDLNQSGEESQHTAGPMEMRVSTATP